MHIRKNVGILAIVSALVVTVFAAVFAETSDNDGNLFKNGDFETGKLEPTKLNRYAIAALGISSEEKHNGNYSLKISNRKDQSCGWGQNVAVEEGKTYILHEEVTADGYVKATDIEFTVSYDKQNEHLEMVDKVLKVIKTDLVTVEEIEGAELQVVDEEGNIIDEWTSTKEAHVVNGLEEGKKYKLIEKTAPYGYELTEEIEFEVTTDKETQLVEMKDMPILNDITLIKIDADTKAKILDKFTFGLYAYKECTQLLQQVDSNKDEGTITFEDLRYGTYYVKEISAPKGYQKSDKVVKVEINDKGIFVDDKLIEKDNNEVYSFEFEDHIIETPKTGDEGHIRIWFAVLGISLVAFLGAIIYFKKFLEK